MDKITQEDVQNISLEAERELSSPLSPKRPRTDSTIIDNHNGESRLGSPELLTFQKYISSPLSINMLQRNVDLVCIAKCGDGENEKLNEHQDTKLIVTPIINLTTSHADDAHQRPSKAWFSAAETRFPLLVKDEQVDGVTECDKLTSNPLDDAAGGNSSESHTSQDTSADVSSHPDCKVLKECLDDKPPGGCSPPAGNGKNGRQVQKSVSWIQVRFYSGCSPDTWIQSVEVEENIQSFEVEFTQNSRENGEGPLSFSDCTDTKSFYSTAEEESSGNLAEGVKKEKKVLELQICENVNVIFCYGETKDQVNENSQSKNSIPSAVECAEGSVVSYDVVSARNNAIENLSLEAEGLYGAKGEHAAGKMIATAQCEMADHTTETLMPARISQEPAEGDNDLDPFGVIGPAIWSETDREAEEKCHNSEKTAGAELCPSVKVCEMEMPLPLCCDVRLSQEVSAPSQTCWQFNRPSRTQQCKDEKEDSCQLHTEPQATSITTNETHNRAGNEGSCLWTFSPSSSLLPPAGDGGKASHKTAGHQFTEQDLHVSVEPLMTQEVEYLQTQIARMDRATEITEASFEVEITTDVRGKSEISTDTEERHKEDETELTCDCINERTAGEMSKHGDKLRRINEELGKNLSDHPYSAAVPLMEETTEDSERIEETSVGEEMYIQDNSAEDAHQQQSPQKGDMTEMLLDDSEWTEGNKSTLFGQHGQENKLICLSNCQSKAERRLVENNDDVLALTVLTSSDAVVPGPHELIPSQNADKNPTALKCRDRFSPSVFAFGERVLGGFDTFEKIQLSLDDDDDNDASLSNSPLLTSLPGQLLETQQRQVYGSMPEAASDKHEVVPGEEEGEVEVERFECHAENMANGFLSCDYSCNELSNLISAAADVYALGRQEQQPNRKSAFNFSQRLRDDTEPQSTFEMKKQFDMVLKELNLYFEISMSDFVKDSRASSPEQYSDTSSCKARLSSPELRHCRDKSSDDADEDRSLDICGEDQVLSCTTGSGEQEVPLGGPLCQEPSTHTAEPQEQKRKMGSPSFMCRPFWEPLSHRPPEQPRRLEPLRTCTRPIRVGLSKRAKTKHLHRPHPYE